jgi:hypothetical protein
MRVHRVAGIAIVLAFQGTGCISMVSPGSMGGMMGPGSMGSMMAPGSMGGMMGPGSLGTMGSPGVAAAALPGTMGGTHAPQATGDYQHGPVYSVQGEAAAGARFTDILIAAPMRQAPLVGLEPRFVALRLFDPQVSRPKIILDGPLTIMAWGVPEAATSMWGSLTGRSELDHTAYTGQLSNSAASLSENPPSIFVGVSFAVFPEEIGRAPHVLR